ncbi:unnamed protein product [Oppiella nova]|uniref:Transmembrane protein n=1 Tax=Oppiella nova TaxID=334625 RepID=A0A7R9MEY7_9ACAR|nr:unnamed protein product [Oppiella nova]CAG2176091.1 unnamed protein product [Oppiella nova]
MDFKMSGQLSVAILLVLLLWLTVSTCMASEMGELGDFTSTVPSTSTGAPIQPSVTYMSGRGLLAYSAISYILYKYYCY